MGGCASKPKDLDTRKMPPPAARKPHAPPEVPVQTMEQKDGVENKESALEDVCEPETSEAKPVNEEGVPVEVKPMEAKVEAEDPPKEEKKEVAESVAVKEEKKEMAETIVPKEEKKKEAEAHVVPKEKKQEVAAA